MATSSRIPAQGSPNQDKTSRILTNALQTPAFAATLNLVTTEFYTMVQVGTLTGAMTINVGVGSASSAPYAGDELQLFFLNASGSTQTVTLGTGVLVTAATLAVPTGKTGNITLVFNGTSWVEIARSITV